MLQSGDLDGLSTDSSSSNEIQHGGGVCGSLLFENSLNLTLASLKNLPHVENHVGAQEVKLLIEIFSFAGALKHICIPKFGDSSEILFD